MNILSTQSAKPHARQHGRRELESVVVRFAGDSGDGIQVLGSKFAAATALAGNDLATFPDFPAEIRAPTGSTYGVSAFQINFGGRAIKTPGDAPDVLVAMNPAALKVELPNLRQGGVLILDIGSFSERNLRKAGYAADPMSDGSLDAYRRIEIDISAMTLEAVKPFGLSQKDALRCKNMWTLGLVYWMYGRERDATIAWMKQRYGDTQIAEANVAALNAGHAYGETAELSGDLVGCVLPAAPIAPGLYRTVTGSEALAWGLMVGAHLAQLGLFFSSYPITPASPVLHILTANREAGVETLQAEDEIAAVCAAIGGSYAGAMGVTSSSGPGIALKAEAIGLAVAAELPLVVIDTQRAGPSTGMPTKTEQSDLNLALFGRHGESPVVVLAARSPSDCFEVAVEAVRLASRYMTPVMLLSDGYIANAAQPWPIPDVEAMTPYPIRFAEPNEAGDGFLPYVRDPETLARPWAPPGVAGLEHRIGGIEKAEDHGHISYDPKNHQRMVDARAAKIDGIARDIPLQRPELGNDRGPLAVVGWGSTYGPINRAVLVMRERGYDVAHIHLRHLNPFPANLGELLAGYERVVVAEMNAGQLVTLLRARYLLPAEPLTKVTGLPFKIEEIQHAILERLEKRA